MTAQPIDIDFDDALTDPSNAVPAFVHEKENAMIRTVQRVC